MTTMTAAVVQAAGEAFILEQRPIPQPGENQLRIKVQACGVCFSDNVIKQGTMPGLALPRVPGHEVAGIVDAVGPGVQGWALGDRVGVGWHGGHCFHCDPCREGDFVTCENKQICGVHYDGGYQEYMLAPAEALARIPNDLTDVEAAPLLCAGVTTYDALRNSAAQAGDLVAVQGIGGLGHLALQYAAKLGFKVVAISNGESKRELAMSLGASDYIDSSAEDAGAALQQRGGAKVVVVTAPHADAVTTLADGLGRNGQLMLVAILHDPIVINSRLLIRKRASIQGWPCGSAIDFESTMKFSAEQAVKAHIERYALSDINQAWEQMISNKARFRVVIDMTL
ncbi:alcohol dehydrogenase [Oceanicoccus sagamiensis]|uniref:Alcohol dehydrogenase n=1 Tax=Oceanicoccus sagamiensis TaxID=716816 RepID=A0A1X9NAT8_9GAMM|nr:alcohol dehydrogenase [Oceanicoccus sagamiensis]ARN75160.1 alcohol dehydrogenase [Oceanicoccus sagamiensis]